MSSFSQAVNIDALAAAEQAQDTKFKLFPDEDTLDEIFDGVKYKDLPYVTIICAMNNTKVYAIFTTNHVVTHPFQPSVLV